MRPARPDFSQSEVPSLAIAGRRVPSTRTYIYVINRVTHLLLTDKHIKVLQLIPKKAYPYQYRNNATQSTLLRRLRNMRRLAQDSNRRPDRSRKRSRRHNDGMPSINSLQSTTPKTNTHPVPLRLGRLRPRMANLLPNLHPLHSRQPIPPLQNSRPTPPRLPALPPLNPQPPQPLHPLPNQRPNVHLAPPRPVARHKCRPHQPAQGPRTGNRNAH